MDYTSLSFRIPSLILSNSFKNESTNYSQNYNSKNPLKIKINEKTNRTFNLKRSSSYLKYILHIVMQEIKF